jgi:hypothetical protein
MGILLDQDVRVIVQDDRHPAWHLAVEFPILPGYSWDKQNTFNRTRSQATTLATTPNRRPGEAYTAEIGDDKLSFTTYADWIVDTNVETPHSLLWRSLIGDTGITSSPTDYTIDFSESNATALLPLNIWFVWAAESTMVSFTQVTVDRAEINIDINSIATIRWDCTARQSAYLGVGSLPTPVTQYPVTNCIVNKLSTLDIAYMGHDYNIPLTGGSLLIENRTEYVKRSRVGYATTTTEHIPGELYVSGKFSAYLHRLNYATIYNTGMLNYETTSWNNIAELHKRKAHTFILNLGGTSTSSGILQLDAHPNAGEFACMFLHIPKVNTGDALTVDIDFELTGLGDYPTLKYLI